MGSSPNKTLKIKIKIVIVKIGDFQNIILGHLANYKVLLKFRRIGVWIRGSFSR